MISKSYLPKLKLNISPVAQAFHLQVCLWGLFIIGLCFPHLSFADDGTSILNFSPPPGDYSVVFLSNIFGIVDGVLHGTGSQIMGAMMGVFNSAVLALGGILIMYTIIVGTMNTAHEGNPLGKNWSSLWVPVRSVIGVGMIMPQASGYCMMQIFVMWVVVQGVGAADKVWNAALSYLDRGGAIVQAQMSPEISLNAASGEVQTGAAVILQSQICMLAIQRTLETVQDKLTSEASNHEQGACYKPKRGSSIDAFCQNPVPAFLTTVNTVNYQQANTGGQNFALPMPNFSSPPYNVLNGICGTLKWNAISSSSFANISTSSTNNNTTLQVTQDELDTAQLSRAIAIQQMYVDLSSVAETIVKNVPVLYPKPDPQPNQPAPRSTPIAWNQYGIPLTTTGTPCTAPGATCVGWGRDSTLAGAPLFNGTEFQGAISDYNAVMLPTLTLISESSNAATANSAREFITGAEQQGWIMAGSYFFNLARINAQNVMNSGTTDTNTGLDGSSINFTQVAQAFLGSTGCAPNDVNCLCATADQTGADVSALCRWIGGQVDQVQTLQEVLSGVGLVQTALTFNPANNGSLTATTGPASSTAIGFMNNSVMVTLPGQPGMTPPQFGMKFNINVSSGPFTLPTLSFPCGGTWWTGCIGSLIGDILYNVIIRNMFNALLNTVVGLINAAVESVLSVPLLALSQIFLKGVAVIQQPSVNPIIALANMGVYYINFAMKTWIDAVMLMLLDQLVPVLGIFVFVIMTLLMPIIGAWLAIMVLIGFTTAYYVPFYPYMIFTFGSIAWLMVVIEAMVAAPIVALGVSSPEGDSAFGKGEHAIMLLLNVFLRPGMMIVGYITAIALSFVSVWIINAGFSNVVAFTQGSATGGSPWHYSWNIPASQAGASSNTGWSGTQQSDDKYNAGQGGSGVTSQNDSALSADTATSQNSNMSTNNSGRGYPGWAGIFGFFFAILVYTTMYLTVVQEAFNLITSLPDKILRWLGGQAETLGQESGKWAEETKGQVKEGGKSTAEQGQKMGAQIKSGIESKISGAGGSGGNVGATPTPKT